MLQTLKNAWRTPDLRNKMIVVFIILVLYRIGTIIPVPFVDAGNFDAQFGDTIFAYLNILSGGAMSSATLFALGVSPYITASIVIQLLTVAIPALEKKIKDGKNGQKFQEMLNRYTTIILAVITGFGYYMLLKNNDMLMASVGASSKFLQVLVAVVIVTCFCAGAALIMWLAEKIDEGGIGNGISMILFANIISSFPSMAIRLYELVRYGGFGNAATGWSKAWHIVGAIAFVLVMVAGMVALIGFIIWVTGSERRIPVQYAKRVVGRKMYGGQNSTLPIKLNMSGVMPIIFASSVVSLPATIMTLFGVKSSSSLASTETPTFWNKFYDFMSPNGWFYPLLLAVLIIAFAYFYISISFNPVEVANNLKKNGGLIPGIRQGRPTADYIKKILNKVTLMGAFFLAIIAILPIAVTPLVNLVVEALMGSTSYNTYFASAFTFGGTSILIVVGVAQETFRTLEAQLTMRNYKGFL
jgi:preprotein translocase subunit SecY